LGLDEPPCEREAETARRLAMLRAGAGDTEERLEDSLADVPRDPDPGVGHDKVDTAVPPRGIDADAKVIASP
jgi:hypothetical protein